MTNTPGLILTSWPASLSAGSGTALFVNALAQAVQNTGRAVTLVNPTLDPTDYTQFTLERLWWNTTLRDDPRLAQAPWWLGLDYDGYAVPLRSGQFRLASARALFADLVDTEPEPFRTLLRAQAFFDGHNFRQADGVTVPSHYAREKLIGYHALPPEKVRVIPNGIDLAEWDALLPPTPPAPHPTVLVVSKLYPRKKVDVLLRALPAVRAHYPDVEVRVAGGGFQWAAWRQLAADVGVADQVTWLGDVSRAQVAAEFARCWVCVHPSIQETFGNVCLESMGARRPLVVSSVTAPAELVRASGAGLVYEGISSEALAHALLTLLGDEPQRAQLGAQGRAFAERHTWHAAAQAYLALLPG